MKKIARFIPLFAFIVLLGPGSIAKAQAASPAAPAIMPSAPLGAPKTGTNSLAPQNVVMLTAIALLALCSGAYVIRIQFRR